MNVIGVNVREVEGRARPIVAPVETGRAAFLIRAARGPAHHPVPVRGFAEFARVFGGLDTETLGGFVVESFFAGGGAEALCVRIAPRTAAVAQQTLIDRTGAPTLRVEAGWRGRPNPGDWADDLEIAVVDNPLGETDAPAQIPGSAAGPFTLADGEQLTLTVDGGVPETVTFATGLFDSIAQATTAEVAAAVSASIRAALVAVTPGGRLLVASREAGPARRIEVSGSAAATLGFTGATANSDAGLEGRDLIALRGIAGFGAGQAVRVETRGRVIGTAALGATTAIPAGSAMAVTADGGTAQTITFAEGGRIPDLAAATPNQVVAEINRQARGFIAGLTEGGALILMSVAAGAGTSIAVAAGATDARAALSLDTAAPVAGAAVAERIAEVSQTGRWIRLEAALPAATPLPAGIVRMRTAEVDIAVLQGGVELERFVAVGMESAADSYAVDVVNDAFAGSDLIRLVDLGSASGPALDLPAVVTRSPMTGTGSDPTAGDADYAGDAAARTGLHALDTEDFELLAYADTTAAAPAADALAYCTARGTALAVLTGPSGADLPAMIDHAAPLRAAVAYGVAIWPHGRVVNPLDRTGSQPLREIPLVGAYCGMLARVGREAGVWISPAGSRARIDVTALAPDSEVTDVAHTDAATRGGVSVIRALPGQGIIADAARNLSTTPAVWLVGSRRLINLIKARLGRNLRFYLQEPINERLFARVRDSINAFMTGLWRRGAFATEDREDAFAVICDRSNNPETQTQLGILTVEVRFRTPPSAEFVVVEVSQSPGETVATETP